MNKNIPCFAAQLPDDVLPEAIECIDKVAHEVGVQDCTALATAVYKSLATEHRGELLHKAMEDLGIGTRDRLLAAVDSYISLKKANPSIFFYKKTDHESNTGESDVSDIALFLIDNIVKKTKVTNRYDVMAHVCEILEHRYGNGDRLEQNLKKLNLKTTKDVLRAVDIYFIMKKLYPDTVFGRKRMYHVWASSFTACLPADEPENTETNRSMKEAS